MARVSRRAFIGMAAAISAAGSWANRLPVESTAVWNERHDLFAEGVASGDPDSGSVLLWTRYSAESSQHSAELHVEVAEDSSFKRVVAAASTEVLASADWTCRVLVGGLKPACFYWYRFTDKNGNGSRIGRTRTAPRSDDPRPVSFAFVSCQNVTQGAQNAYRRMIYEDARTAEANQFDFVLHLGDFIYEITWYPEDRPLGMYDRKIRDVYRYPDGEKIRDFHIPTTVEGYRTAYRAYLHDPDLQEARARWPFVNMWDNHEFSWLGWQSFQKFEGKTHAAQTRKVAANQAFFEYQPARMARPNSRSLTQFHPPHVTDAPINSFDDHGLGEEPNNLAAIGSLKGYRAIRWGRNVDLIVTDQRSYRSEEPTDMAEAKGLLSDDFPGDDVRRCNENPRCGAGLQQGAAAGHDTVARWKHRDSEHLAESPAANYSRCGAEVVVSRSLETIERRMEDMGQHDSYSRHARRSTEPPTGCWQAMAMVRLCKLRGQWRSQHRLRRARGDI